MLYKNDVFISYHESDRQWVHGELLRRLKDGRVNYCEPGDFKIGKLKLGEIDDAIINSRRTLLITSEKYFEDGFNELIKGMALALSLETRHWSVVPVVICPNVKLPLTLRALVPVNLCAPGDEDWRNLIHALRSEFTDEEMARPKQESSVDPHAASDGLKLLPQLMSTSEIKTALRDYRKEFEDFYRSMSLLDVFKALHMKFQAVESSFKVVGNYAKPDSSGLPNWDDLQEPVIDLCDGFDDLIKDACACPFAEDTDPWVVRLRRALGTLKDATDKHDFTRLNSVIGTLSQTFNRIPSQLNNRMLTEAKTLELSSLGAALMRVHGVLKEQPSPPPVDDLTRIEDCAARIYEMDHNLKIMVHVHDSLQQIDNEVRRVEVEGDVSEIVGMWDDLKPKMERLSNDASSAWAKALVAAGAQLQGTIPEEGGVPVEPNNLKKQFKSYRSQVTRSFNRVDSDMLKRCKEVNEEVSKPLVPLLIMLQT